MKAEETPCPVCGQRALRIEVRTTLVARPVGTFSVAGAQLKVSANERDWPWLVCGACGVEAAAKGDE